MSGSERFYAAAAALPLLTHEQEIQLGRRSLAGDQRARNQLVEHNIRLCHKVAGYYNHRNPTAIKDDLIQAGLEGLIIAARKYDPARGTRFSTYAMWYIQKYVRTHIAQTHSRVMSVPAQVAYKYFSKRMTGEERAAYKRRHFESLSINGILPGSKSIQMADALPDPIADTAQQAIDRDTFERCVHRFASLPETQQQILARYAGVRSDPETVDEIASSMDATPEWVQHQIEQATAALQETANE